MLYTEGLLTHPFSHAVCLLCLGSTKKLWKYKCYSLSKKCPLVANSLHPKLIQGSQIPNSNNIVTF